MGERYWSGETRLYSDGYFEVLWGVYKSGLKKVLGVHWCETSESYPCPKLYGGDLGWLVVPPFLTLSTLNGLLSDIKTNPSHGAIDGILCAIKEFAEQDMK